MSGDNKDSLLLAQKTWLDGEPCKHPGCLSHITHPCERCGRIAGHQPMTGIEKAKIFAETLTDSCCLCDISCDEYCYLFGQFIVAKEFLRILQQQQWKSVEKDGLPGYNIMVVLKMVDCMTSKIFYLLAQRVEKAGYDWWLTDTCGPKKIEYANSAEWREI